MRRNEKLTLCPDWLPLPVSSHRDAIFDIHSLLHYFFNLSHCTDIFLIRQDGIIGKMINITYLAIVLVTILLSMTLHEAMHAFMGYFLGDDTAKVQGRLTLNPIKHIDPFMTIILPLMLALLGAPVFGGAKPVPFNPNRVRYGDWGAMMVALAGPLTNLLIAFLAFGVGVVSGLITSGAAIATSMPGLIIQTVVLVNLGFFVFNMIPLPPLDGSRVLYAVAPESVRRGMEYIEQYGVMLVFAVVLLASPVISTVMLTATNGILQGFITIFRL